MSYDRRVRRSAVGYNADVATTAEVISNVAGGLTIASIKSTMATAATIQISSADAKDTAAGVGARTVDVCILDSNYKKKVVTVSMAGQTAVDVGTGHAVLWAKVKTVGSELDNAGIIDIGVGTVSSGSNDALLGSIAAGANRTQMAVDAADVHGPIVIEDVMYQNVGQILDLEIVEVTTEGLAQKRLILDGIASGDAKNVTVSLTIPAKTLVYVTGVAATSTTAVTATITSNKL